MIAEKNETFGDNEEEKEIDGEDDDFSESDNSDSDSDTSDSDDSDGGPKLQFIPRVVQNAYKLYDDKEMKIAKGTMKFTKGSNPETIKKIKYMINESVACPAFLPMEEEDSIVTPTAI